MSSTCFEREGSSSGRRLSLQVWIACKRHSIPYLYIQPSSWRWTLGFETCRRHHKLRIKILIKNCAFRWFILYNFFLRFLRNSPHIPCCYFSFPNLCPSNLALLYWVSVRFFVLRILRVSWCPLDRLPARRRVSLVVGLPPDASRPACFSVGVFRSSTDEIFETHTWNNKTR